jgi:aminopeptidase 2
MQENWAAVEEKMGATLGMIGYVIQRMADILGTTKHLREFEEFFAKRDTSTYSSALSQSLDSLKAKVAWVERDREDVASWLDATAVVSEQA